MPNQIADLSIKLSANALALQGGLGKGVGYAQNYANRVTGIMGKVGGGGAIFGSILGGGAFAKSIETKLYAIKDMGREARKVGLDVSTFSQLMLTAGADSEAMGVGLKHLRRELGQVGIGAHLASGQVQDTSAGLGLPGASAGKATRDKFKAMGLDADSMAAMPLAKALGVVADRMKSLTNDNDKAALAFSIFGKRGQELIPILEQGSAALDKNRAALHAKGFDISASDVAASGEALKAIRENQRAWDAMCRQLAVSLAPLIKMAAGVASHGVGTALAGGAAGAYLGGIKGAVAGAVLGGAVDLGNYLRQFTANGVADRGAVEIEAQKKSNADRKNDAWNSKAQDLLRKGATGGAEDLAKRLGIDAYEKQKDGTWSLSKYGMGVFNAMQGILHPLGRTGTIEESTKKFQEAIKYGGLTKYEKAIKEAKDAGATPKEMADLQELKRQAVEHDLGTHFKDTWKAIDVVEMGSEAARAKQLKKDGAGDLAIKMDEKVNRRLEAAKMIDAQKDPMQKFGEEMDRIHKLKEDGLLDEKQAAAQTAKAYGGLDQMTTEHQKIGALKEGGQEGLSSFAQFQRRQAVRDPIDVMLAGIEASEDQSKAEIEQAKRIEDAIAKIGLPKIAKIP